MEGEGGENGNAHDDSMHIAMLTHSEECTHVDAVRKLKVEALYHTEKTNTCPSDGRPQ